MSSKQKTIKNQASLSGYGIHTGNKVLINFKPALENHGIVFSRIDLPGSPKIEAIADYVVDTSRATTLKKGEVTIITSEHVLAAVAALEIDNILIELNAPEPPIMDGSSKYFLEALEQAIVVEQNAIVKEYVVTEVITHKDEETGSEITLIPSDSFQVDTMIDFETKVLGTQNAKLNSLKDFKTEIAAARTFCFLHELEMLIDHNLIKGGDLNNAIVYVNEEPSEITKNKIRKAFDKEDIEVTDFGILNNLKIRWSNEAARHKLLDLIGDLLLAGTKIRGKVISYKPGHKVNTDFAKKLRKKINLEKRNKIPKFDLDKKPLMDIHQIMDVLPHRPPFLLIDRILELSENHVVGMKNVTMNEQFFIGHFPEAPVMPGVLQVEAMAQCGGILVLSTVPDPENYLTYFMKMDNVKFKQKVLPGDTVIFCCELITPIRRGICHMKSSAYANGKLVAEAELMAQIAKK